MDTCESPQITPKNGGKLTEEQESYRRKYLALKRKCETVEASNKRLANRVVQVRKALSKLTREKRGLQLKLDQLKDDYKCVEMTVPLEDGPHIHLLGFADPTLPKSMYRPNIDPRTGFPVSPPAASKASSSSKPNKTGLHDSADKTRKRKSKDSSKADKEKDPNAPKKPANAFLMFCQEKRTTVQEDQTAKSGVELSHSDLTKELAKQWNDLSEEVKKLFRVKLERVQNRVNRMLKTNNIKTMLHKERYYDAYEKEKAKYVQEVKNYSKMTEKAEKTSTTPPAEAKLQTTIKPEKDAPVKSPSKSAAPSGSKKTPKSKHSKSSRQTPSVAMPSAVVSDVAQALLSSISNPMQVDTNLGVPQNFHPNIPIDAALSGSRELHQHLSSAAHLQQIASGMSYPLSPELRQQFAAQMLQMPSGVMPAVPHGSSVPMQSPGNSLPMTTSSALMSPSLPVSAANSLTTERTIPLQPGMMSPSSGNVPLINSLQMPSAGGMLSMTSGGGTLAVTSSVDTLPMSTWASLAMTHRAALQMSMGGSHVNVPPVLRQQLSPGLRETLSPEVLSSMVQQQMASSIQQTMLSGVVQALTGMRHPLPPDTRPMMPGMTQQSSLMTDVKHLMTMASNPQMAARLQQPIINNQSVPDLKGSAHPHQGSSKFKDTHREVDGKLSNKMNGTVLDSAIVSSITGDKTRGFVATTRPQVQRKGSAVPSTMNPGKIVNTSVSPVITTMALGPISKQPPLSKATNPKIKPPGCVANEKTKIVSAQSVQEKHPVTKHPVSTDVNNSAIAVVVNNGKGSFGTTGAGNATLSFKEQSQASTSKTDISTTSGTSSPSSDVTTKQADIPEPSKHHPKGPITVLSSKQHKSSLPPLSSCPVPPKRSVRHSSPVSSKQGNVGTKQTSPSPQPNTQRTTSNQKEKENGGQEDPYSFDGE